MNTYQTEETGIPSKIQNKDNKIRTIWISNVNKYNAQNYYNMIVTMNKIKQVRTKISTEVAIVKDFKETQAWQATH